MNEYKQHMWNKTKEIVDKISTVMDIEKAVVLGSFTTDKERPADVDLIILLKTSDTDDNWSTDIVFTPNNKFGEDTLNDAMLWMDEKYGRDNYEIFEYIINK